MKKLMLVAGCAAVMAAALVSFGADPDVVWREKVRTVVGTNGVVVATDTNVVTEATQKTPAYRGQLLFGSAGAGTNAVWVAKGLTTNDWVRLAP